MTWLECSALTLDDVTPISTYLCLPPLQLNHPPPVTVSANLQPPRDRMTRLAGGFGTWVTPWLDSPNTAEKSAPWGLVWPCTPSRVSTANLYLVTHPWQWTNECHHHLSLNVWSWHNKQQRSNVTDIYSKYTGYYIQKYYALYGVNMSQTTSWVSLTIESCGSRVIISHFHWYVSVWIVLDTLSF